MTDAIIKFPGAVKAKANRSPEIENAVKEIETLMSKQSPTNGSEVYETMNIQSVPRKLKTVTDIMSGGEKRNPRWGIYISFNLIPQLDKAPIGPVLIPTPPGQLITADSAAALKERLFFELEKALALAELAEKNPQAYRAYEEQVIASLGGHYATSEDNDVDDDGN